MIGRLAFFVSNNTRLSWLVTVSLAAVVGLAAASTVRSVTETERLSRLGVEANRQAIAIMSQTLNGNLMGSVAVLGLLDEEIKAEGLWGGVPTHQAS
ncbi:hypothetical protein [Magnetospirillum sp. SS-4]|uniref:hypothetical protein n=1 Tax=Magnetospirillum sp. SS-4 TaxID=2681465 RepID=UPI00137D4C3D|nr:hypothetical protein [Magnetospirillum sp. SS-4]CAA7627443.1 exported hypothetical protein [Magnetospirillum sp. SS-4]